MVDLSWLVLRRAAEVSRLRPVIAFAVCLALSIPAGVSARGASGATAAETNGTELQQPKHILPLPASPAESEPKTVGAIAGPIRKPSRQTLGKSPQVRTVGQADYVRVQNEEPARQVAFQIPEERPATKSPLNLAAPTAPAAPAKKKRDPCEDLSNRPFDAFGISIAIPSGTTPEDYATDCWTPINSSAGPLAGARSWGATTFAWNATCLCHRPLYFEEINLERYGYGCCECIQPAASAAHFFATIPTLPYCMATDCPGKCIYTLGHYRPGNCNPRQCHWPRWSTRAALAEGGVWTGMVFLIP